VFEHQFVGEVRGVLAASGEEVVLAVEEQPRFEVVRSAEVEARYHFHVVLYDAGTYHLEMRLFLAGPLARRSVLLELSDAVIAPESDCDQANRFWREIMLVDLPIGRHRFRVDAEALAAAPAASGASLPLCRCVLCSSCSALSALVRLIVVRASGLSRIASCLCLPPSDSRGATPKSPPVCAFVPMSATRSLQNGLTHSRYADVVEGRWVGHDWRPAHCHLPPQRRGAALRYGRIFLVGTSETRYLFDAICRYRFPSTQRAELAHATYRSDCGPFHFLSNCDDNGRFGKRACRHECANLNLTLSALHAAHGALAAGDLLVYSCGLHQYRVSAAERRAQYEAVRQVLVGLPGADWVVRTTNAVNFRRVRVRRYCWSRVTYTREREALMRNNLRAHAHAQAAHQLFAPEHLLDVYRLTSALWNSTRDHVHFPPWTYDTLARLHLTLWSDRTLPEV
jgi:hypothetical protein